MYIGIVFKHTEFILHIVFKLITNFSRVDRDYQSLWLNVSL